MNRFVQSLQDALGTLLNYIPRLIGALLVLLIGYIIAKVLAKGVTLLLQRLHVDDALSRFGVQRFLDRTGTKMTPATLLGKVVFWFVFIIVLTMFANALGIPAISGFLNQMIAYIPNVFAAIVIILLAVVLGRFLAGLVRGLSGSDSLAKATQVVIVVYGVFVALVQLHIAQALTGSTFLIVLGGLALAAGLAFGLGGRDEAKRLIEHLSHRVAATSPQAQGSTTDGGAGEVPLPPTDPQV